MWIRIRIRNTGKNTYFCPFFNEIVVLLGKVLHSVAADVAEVCHLPVRPPGGVSCHSDFRGLLLLSDFLTVDCKKTLRN